MRILIDMDGVLADFDGGLFTATADFIEWPEEALARTRRFCTDYLGKREAKAVRAFIEKTDFFRDLPVIPGARLVVEDLLERGHDLWVCSKPLEANPWCANSKMAWIEEHFPELSGKVILAPNKGMIAGDVLLDDAIKERDIAGASWVPVHYTYPHNADRHGHRFTWADGATALEEVANYQWDW